MSTETQLPTKEDFDKLYSQSNKTFCYRSIFWEKSPPESRDKFPPLFTLKLVPHKGLPSAYQVYMDSIDEYDAALKIMPNMKEWEKLIATSWFLDGDPNKSHQGLKTWREHMKARDASLAKKVLIKETEGGSVSAARVLLTESKVKAPVGRKSKKIKDKSQSNKVTDMKKFIQGRV